MGLDTPPQGALGGDLDRIRADLEVGEAKLFEMRRKGVPIAELPVAMIGQACDYMGCQVALAHIGEGLGIDHIIAVTGPQKVQEVCTVLRLKRLGMLYQCTCVGLGYGLMWRLFPGTPSRPDQSIKVEQHTEFVTIHWLQNIKVVVPNQVKCALPIWVQ